MKIKRSQEAIEWLCAKVFGTAKDDRTRCLAALKMLPESVDGERGHDIMLLACCEIFRYGFGRDSTTAKELADWYNDNMCHPPWSEREVEKKLRDAFEKVAVDHTFGEYATKKHTGFTLDLLTCGEFLAKEYKRDWLIKDVLVTGEPAVLGGPKKCLKTSMLLDLVIALSTKTPFLGKFEVPNMVPSMVLSGESGGATLQETIHRICRDRGIAPPTDTLLIGETLPQLSVPEHLMVLRSEIIAHQIGFCAIDPAYLCTLQKGSSESSSNVFAIGTILLGLSQIGAETGCTVAVIHHAKKPPGREEYRQPELGDMTGAGWQEWMRQWIILNHRERMRDGQFKLWMLVGGSAGHHGTFAVDVDEGHPEDPLLGRDWKVVVNTEDELIHEEKVNKARADMNQFEDDTKMVLQFLLGGDEHSLAKMISLTGLPKIRVETILEELVTESRIMADVTGRHTAYRYVEALN